MPTWEEIERAKAARRDSSTPNNQSSAGQRSAARAEYRPATNTVRTPRRTRTWLKAFTETGKLLQAGFYFLLGLIVVLGLVVLWSRLETPWHAVSIVGAAAVLVTLAAYLRDEFDWLETATWVARGLAGAVLIILLLYLLIMNIRIVGEPSSPPDLPLGPPNDRNDQEEIQVRYRDARLALEDGVVVANTTASVTVGTTYTLRVRVCGHSSLECDGTYASLTESPNTPTPEATSAPIQVGARIEGSIIAGEGIAVSPAVPSVQPVMGADESATWVWSIRATAAGEHVFTIRLRVLFAETDDSLQPDTLIDASLVAKQSWWSVTWRWIGDAWARLLGALVALVSLGITAPVAWKGFKALRKWLGARRRRRQNRVYQRPRNGNRRRPVARSGKR